MIAVEKVYLTAVPGHVSGGSDDVPEDKVRVLVGPYNRQSTLEGAFFSVYVFIDPTKESLQTARQMAYSFFGKEAYEVDINFRDLREFTENLGVEEYVLTTLIHQ